MGKSSKLKNFMIDFIFITIIVFLMLIFGENVLRLLGNKASLKQLTEYMPHLIFIVFIFGAMLIFNKTNKKGMNK